MCLICEKIVAVLMLIILSPLMLMIAIAIKFFSPGKIIFSQNRVGKDGRNFQMYKFRTMIENAERQTGAVLSWNGDPRVTKLGRLLRMSHLDEVPQLFNVLKNEMSLIGPRPERPEMTKHFIKEIQNYSLREKVRPGITGLAQVLLPYSAKAEQKLWCDLYYIMNQKSLQLNSIIVLFTLKKLILLRPSVSPKPLPSFLLIREENLKVSKTI